MREVSLVSLFCCLLILTPPFHAAIKHIRNLSSLLTSKNDIETCTILFCLNRVDCNNMRACWEQDPTFAEELEKARGERKKRTFEF